MSYSVELGIRRPGRETWLCALGPQPPPHHSRIFFTGESGAGTVDPLPLGALESPGSN